MRAKWVAIILLVSFYGVMTGCTYTTVRENADFAQAKRKIDTVAILPPDAEITYIVFNGDNQRMHDQEEQATKDLYDTAAQILSDHGYTVANADFNSLISSNSDMAFDLTQIKSTAKEQVKEIYSEGAVRTDQPRYFSKSVGANINPFAEYAKADALLYIDYSGFEKSPGMVTKDIAAGVLLAVLTGNNQAQVAPAKGGNVFIALLDGTSGDILWTNSGGTVLAPGDTLKTELGNIHKKGEAEPNANAAAGSDGNSTTTDTDKKSHQESNSTVSKI
jgi:hypothetical protein